MPPVLMLIALLAFGPLVSAKRPAQEQKPLSPELVRQVHGRVFAGSDPGAIQRRLREGRGDIELPRFDGPPLLMIPTDPRQQLEILICDSRLVVAGVVERQQVFRTADDGFLYTEMNVVIQDIIKDALGISPGKKLIVLRRGGEIVDGGRKIIARGDHYLDNVTTGALHLFFLGRMIPETEAFTSERASIPLTPPTQARGCCGCICPAFRAEQGRLA